MLIASSCRPNPVQLLRPAGAVRQPGRAADRLVPRAAEAGDAVPGRGEVPPARPRGGGAEEPRVGAGGAVEAEPARVEDADGVRRELFQDGPGDGVLWVRAVAVRGDAVRGGAGVLAARVAEHEAAADCSGAV